MSVKQLDEKITEEFQGLSENEIEKIIKMIHLLKTEFLREKKKASTQHIKKKKGAWKGVDVEDMYKNVDKLSWKMGAKLYKRRDELHER